MVIVSILGEALPTPCCISSRLARSVGLNLTLQDFQNVSNRTPFLADFKPSGKYVMEDLHAVGGTPAVIKMLIEAGMFDGSCADGLSKIRQKQRLPCLHLANELCSRCGANQGYQSHQILRGAGMKGAQLPRSRARKGCDSPVPPVSMIPKN